jgi:ribonuclease HIII
MISKKSLPNKLGSQYLTSHGLIITVYNTGKLVVQGKSVFPASEEFQSLQDLLGPQTNNLIRALTERFKKERQAGLPNAEQAYKLIRLLAVRLTQNS